jgi:crossover junction endodeoxyribonuclease RuvC
MAGRPRAGRRKTIERLVDTGELPYPLVMGLDLSLTSTGIAAFIGGEFASSHKIKAAAKERGLPRLRIIRDAIIRDVRTADLIVVEGPSYGSRGQGQHERAGLWWIVYDALEALKIPTAVAPPTTIKKYATGKGNSEKDRVVGEAYKRFSKFGGNNDEADALWMAAMGTDYLIQESAVPEANRAALNGVAWPFEDDFPPYSGPSLVDPKAGP